MLFYEDLLLIGTKHDEIRVVGHSHKNYKVLGNKQPTGVRGLSKVYREFRVTSQNLLSSRRYILCTANPSLNVKEDLSYCAQTCL